MIFSCTCELLRFCAGNLDRAAFGRSQCSSTTWKHGASGTKGGRARVSSSAVRNAVTEWLSAALGSTACSARSSSKASLEVSSKLQGHRNRAEVCQSEDAMNQDMFFLHYFLIATPRNFNPSNWFCVSLLKLKPP